MSNFQLYKIQISLPGELKVKVYFWKFPYKNFAWVSDSINFKAFWAINKKFSDLSESNHMGLDWLFTRVKFCRS